MLLKELTSIDKDFVTSGLRFTLTDHDAVNSIATFMVTDDGDLTVGEFSVDYNNMQSMDYIEPPEYPNILERLRKTGESNTISRGILRIIKNLLVNG